MLRPQQSDFGITVATRIAVAFTFTLTGMDKFLVSAYWTQVFAAIGLGQWFRYFTGIVEIFGGLLFLVPATTTFGAVLLIATMIGAMCTQAFVFKWPADSLFPAIYLVGVVIAYLILRPVTHPTVTTVRPVDSPPSNEEL
jgi:putative oxidoreductase